MDSSAGVKGDEADVALRYRQIHAGGIHFNDYQIIYY